MNIPPGFAQVNLVFDGSGAPRGMQIALGVEVGAPPVGVAYTAQEVAASVGQSYLDNFQDYLPSVINLKEARAKFGPNETGPFAVYGFGTAGTWAQAPDSPQVCVLLTKHTALGGRPNRGRIYHPCPAEIATNSGGVIASANLDGYNTKAAAFLADLATANLNMVLLHSSEELAPTEVTSITCNPTLATQRRRIRRVGSRRRII